MKAVAVLRFPGTQCEKDVVRAFKFLSIPAQVMDGRDRFEYRDFGAVILPGGFSYGDYLRAGALAARTPALKDVQAAARKGWPILGICNGFQILCEVGLLPGTLQINHHLKFIHKWVRLQIQRGSQAWGGDFSSVGQNFSIPIAHKEGRFYASGDQIKELQDTGGIWLTYLKNPNGSLQSIAGVKSKTGHVAGLMPHPERAIDSDMGGDSGLFFFKSLALGGK